MIIVTLKFHLFYLSLLISVIWNSFHFTSFYILYSVSHFNKSIDLLLRGTIFNLSRFTKQKQIKSVILLGTVGVVLDGIPIFPLVDVRKFIVRAYIRSICHIIRTTIKRRVYTSFRLNTANSNGKVGSNTTQRDRTMYES